MSLDTQKLRAAVHTLRGLTACLCLLVEDYECTPASLVLGRVAKKPRNKRKRTAKRIGRRTA